MITLHDLHQEDLQDPLHPSTFEEYHDYQILVLRLPEHIGNKAKFHSYGFVLHQQKVYYYDQNAKNLLYLTDDLNGLYHFLDTKIDTLMNEIDKMQEKIVTLETKLYRQLGSRFMEHWHAFKEELSHSERIILKAVDVLGMFITKSKSNTNFPLNEFNDLHEHLERTLRTNVSANDQLNNLYNYYTLRSNDRMNRSIYILTIVSIIFLPLNLVVGFFGMNTGGLPFQDSTMGTTYAFISMILFTAILAIAVFLKIERQ